VEITCVTVDCREPAKVALFWNDALGWDGVAASPDGSGAICAPAAGGIYLEFIRVPEGKSGKNRVHLGCTAGPLDRLDGRDFAAGGAGGVGGVGGGVPARGRALLPQRGPT
jgi:hypothetical protein